MKLHCAMMRVEVYTEHFKSLKFTDAVFLFLQLCYTVYEKLCPVLPFL